jgi:hypothetical protein
VDGYTLTLSEVDLALGLLLLHTLVAAICFTVASASARVGWALDEDGPRAWSRRLVGWVRRLVLQRAWLRS